MALPEPAAVVDEDLLHDVVTQRRGPFAHSLRSAPLTVVVATAEFSVEGLCAAAFDHAHAATAGRTGLAHAAPAAARMARKRSSL